MINNPRNCPRSLTQLKVVAVVRGAWAVFTDYASYSRYMPWYQALRVDA
jgi:hypothetical protein